MNRLLEKGVAGRYFVGQDPPGQGQGCFSFTDSEQWADGKGPSLKGAGGGGPWEVAVTRRGQWSSIPGA